MNRQSKRCKDCRDLRGGKYLRRKCRQCRKAFTIHQSQSARGQGKYCSRQCARKGSPTRQREGVECLCQWCGSAFYRTQSDLKKTVRGNVFCSTHCWREFNVGDRHHNWTGCDQGERATPEYRRWRRRVMRRDYRICRLCHSPTEPQAHHIRRFATHPSLRTVVGNGVILCKSCHKQLRGHEDEYADALESVAAVLHFHVDTENEYRQAFANMGPDA